MKNKPTTYAEAMEELTAIQNRLQGELNDLDRLIEDVKRARFLISWCNEKLENTESLLVDILREGAPSEEE